MENNPENSKSSSQLSTTSSLSLGEESEDKVTSELTRQINEIKLMLKRKETQMYREQKTEQLDRKSQQKRERFEQWEKENEVKKKLERERKRKEYEDTLREMKEKKKKLLEQTNTGEWFTEYMKSSTLGIPLVNSNLEKIRKEEEEKREREKERQRLKKIEIEKKRVQLENERIDKLKKLNQLDELKSEMVLRKNSVQQELNVAKKREEYSKKLDVVERLAKEKELKRLLKKKAILVERRQRREAKIQREKDAKKINEIGYLMTFVKKEIMTRDIDFVQLRNVEAVVKGYIDHPEQMKSRKPEEIQKELISIVSPKKRKKKKKKSPVKKMAKKKTPIKKKKKNGAKKNKELFIGDTPTKQEESSVVKIFENDY